MKHLALVFLLLLASCVQNERREIYTPAQFAARMGALEGWTKEQQDAYLADLVRQGKQNDPVVITTTSSEIDVAGILGIVSGLLSLTGLGAWLTRRSTLKAVERDRGPAKPLPAAAVPEFQAQFGPARHPPHGYTSGVTPPPT